MSDTKRCSRCTKTKAHIEFYETTARKDGLSYLCKPCTSEQSAYNKARRRAAPPKPEPTEAERASRACCRCRVRKPFTDFYRCHSKVNGYASHCIPCSAVIAAAAAAKALAKRKAAGRCIACGKSPQTGGLTTCESCTAQRNEYSRQLRARRRAEGRCIICGSAAADAGNVCMSCWFRRVAGDTLKNLNAAETLRSIWLSQNGACALTGDPLTPGNYGASVDHIVPVSKGGAHDASNLRWVTYQVNYSKSDLSDAAFLDMCRRVVLTADAQRTREHPPHDRSKPSDELPDAQVDRRQDAPGRIRRVV